MAEAPGRYASLTAESIRRVFAKPPTVVPDPAPARVRLGSDLRLFLAAWALGFLFFLAFLA